MLYYYKGEWCELLPPGVNCVMIHWMKHDPEYGGSSLAIVVPEMIIE